MSYYSKFLLLKKKIEERRNLISLERVALGFQSQVERKEITNKEAYFLLLRSCAIKEIQSILNEQKEEEVVLAYFLLDLDSSYQVIPPETQARIKAFYEKEESSVSEMNQIIAEGYEHYFINNPWGSYFASASLQENLFRYYLAKKTIKIDLNHLKNFLYPFSKEEYFAYRKKKDNIIELFDDLYTEVSAASVMVKHPEKEVSYSVFNPFFNPCEKYSYGYFLKSTKYLYSIANEQQQAKLKDLLKQFTNIIQLTRRLHASQSFIQLGKEKLHEYLLCNNMDILSDTDIEKWQENIKNEINLMTSEVLKATVSLSEALPTAKGLFPTDEQGDRFKPLIGVLTFIGGVCLGVAGALAVVISPFFLPPTVAIPLLAAGIIAAVAGIIAAYVGKSIFSTPSLSKRKDVFFKSISRVSKGCEDIADQSKQLVFSPTQQDLKPIS